MSIMFIFDEAIKQLRLSYTLNLRLIVTSDIEKNRAVRTIIRASAQRRSR